MRLAAITTLLLTLGYSQQAAAEPEDMTAEEWVAQGEELGRQGNYGAALDYFRRAEEVTPKAIHDCYVAIAHSRLEQWTAARFFLDRCAERAGAAVPIVWYPTARSEVDGATATFARLSISASLGDVSVRLPALPHLELAAPAALWVPAGTYKIIGTADGYDEYAIDVTLEERGRASIELELMESTPMPLPERPQVRPRRSRSIVPGAAVLGLGGAGVAGGVYAHILFRGTVSDINAGQDGRTLDELEYNRLEDRAKKRRVIAVGLYATSAAVLGVGAYLIFKARRKAELTPLVTSDGDGVALSLSGSF